MYCLLHAPPGLSKALIIVYTCLWLPSMRLKGAVLGVLGFLLRGCRCQQPQDQPCNFQLPMGRFQDLGRKHGEEEKSSCSICLGEFEGEDVVSKLHRCGHVFHMDCIERWLDRCHFTCPLCRTILFSVPIPSHAKQR